MTSPWFQRIWRYVSTRRSAKEHPAVQPTARDLGFTVGGLNIEAARRQAKFGKGYARNSQTAAQLKDLRQQTVTLPPHPSWTGDYTDWVADPFTDRNWRFQFHTLRWINPYLWDALDGNHESQAEWKRIVRSWAEHNTPPHRAPDQYAWLDMTDGNRAIQLSIGAPLISPDDHWYIDLLVEHRNWLLDDDNIVPGNHGLHQNLGLFVVAVVLNDVQGIQRAIERLSEQLLEAFDAKGLNEEGSVGYHQMNLVWWSEAERRLKLEGLHFPQDAEERLDKAGHTMGYLLMPDGTMPQIGDGGRGNGRRRLHPFIDQILKGKITDQNLPTFSHYDNGFTISRSGWGENRPLAEESHTVVRHGKDLQRHSHNDRGSVHIYAHGRPWIVDGGFHSYQQNDADRDYTKSRLAHSLVDLPGQAHDITGVVPVTLTQATAELHSVELMDENFESATSIRRVTFLPRENIWVIWDRIQAETSELVQQQWLLDLGVDPRQVERNSLALEAPQHTLQMHWFGDEPTFDIVQGDTASPSKRGLIGVRWKQMETATSVHANFQGKNVESIVVIVDAADKDLDIALSHHQPMNEFTLNFVRDSAPFRLRHTNNVTHFEYTKHGKR